MILMRMFSLPAIGVAALLLAGCEVDVKSEGEMPEIDVSTDPGKMPEVDVKTPKIDAEMEEKTVKVPDIDVQMEEKKVKVPDIDIDAPAEGEAGEDP